MHATLQFSTGEIVRALEEVLENQRSLRERLMWMEFMDGPDIGSSPTFFLSKLQCRPSFVI